jgi:hypothetical protein
VTRRPRNSRDLKIFLKSSWHSSSSTTNRGREIHQEPKTVVVVCVLDSSLSVQIVACRQRVGGSQLRGCSFIQIFFTGALPFASLVTPVLQLIRAAKFQ